VKNHSTYLLLNIILFCIIVVIFYHWNSLGTNFSFLNRNQHSHTIACGDVIAPGEPLPLSYDTHSDLYRSLTQERHPYSVILYVGDCSRFELEDYLNHILNALQDEPIMKLYFICGVNHDHLVIDSYTDIANIFFDYEHIHLNNKITGTVIVNTKTFKVYKSYSYILNPYVLIEQITFYYQ